MSLPKSLKQVLATASKVEVVSTCVWTHTEPSVTICEFTGSLMFVHAALHSVSNPIESRIRTVFVTTTEHNWNYRFPITASELGKVAAYQFVKEMPSMMSKTLGIHASGFFRMKEDRKQKEVMDDLCRIEVDFNQSIENGIREYRLESVSVNDPVIEESSTVADATDDIKPNQFGSVVFKPSTDTTQNS